jgi:hypothetical protein
VKHQKQPKTFEQVVTLIKGEREYQDSRWNNDGDVSNPHQHTPEEWVVYIEDYLQEMKHTLSREDEEVAYPKALEIFRKITAMGFACIEQNGCNPRNIVGTKV